MYKGGADRVSHRRTAELTSIFFASTTSVCDQHVIQHSWAGKGLYDSINMGYLAIVAAHRLSSLGEGSLVLGVVGIVEPHTIGVGVLEVEGDDGTGARYEQGASHH